MYLVNTLIFGFRTSCTKKPFDFGVAHYGTVQIPFKVLSKTGIIYSLMTI